MSSCRNSANPSNKIKNCLVLPTGPEGSLVACILVARLTETKQTLVFTITLLRIHSILLKLIFH